MNKLVGVDKGSREGATAMQGNLETVQLTNESGYLFAAGFPEQAHGGQSMLPV